jgi:FkbM family methyltransferase
VRSIVRSVLRRAGWQLRRLPATALPRLQTCRCDGVSFPFWIANEHAERWWAGNEVRFDAELAFLKRVARPGAVVVEVGAHHGMLTVQLARWVGAEGRVHAFELNAENALVLAANLGVNRLFQAGVIHAAVWEREGAVGAEGERVGSAGASVPMVSLDAWLRRAGVGRVDLLKVDVEGYEGHVLRGAREILASGPALDLELHLDDLARYGDTLDTVWSELALAGREVTAMVRPRWFEAAPLADRSGLPAAGVVNLLVAPAP